MEGFVRTSIGAVQEAPSSGPILGPRAHALPADLGLVAWLVLPVGRWLLFGTLSMDFSIFILSGIVIVAGASWALIYNADLLLGAVTAVFGRSGRWPRSCACPWPTTPKRIPHRSRARHVPDPLAQLSRLGRNQPLS